MKRKIELGPVEKTLLIPLYCRAAATRNHGGLLYDPWAVEMVQAIDYDFKSFDDATMVVGGALRTALFDEWVRRFIALHPDGTVFEIGAGLNTRFERLDNGRLTWVDLDLPDAMRLRRQFFRDTDRRRSVAASVLDATWPDVAKMTPSPHFLVAEGVFVYLREEEVQSALALIAERFPGACLAFDTADRRVVESVQLQRVMRHIGAPLRWACESPRVVESWNFGYRLRESRSLLNLPASLQRRLPLPYRYWTPIARALGWGQIDAHRLNLYTIRATADCITEFKSRSAATVS